MFRQLRNYTIYLFITLFALWQCVDAMALPLDSYAPSSRFSSGRWVKIAVEETGPHLITAEQLRRWGFNDVNKVRVYGYGGYTMDEKLTTDGYIDDIPEVLSESVAKGLVFYAMGPYNLEKLNGIWSRRPNYYSQKGYYYLAESEESRVSAAVTATPGATGTPATTFTETVTHELEQVSPGSTGHEFLGENFMQRPVQAFKFDLPGTTDDAVSFRCRFAAKTVGASGRISYNVNGENVADSGNDIVPVSSDDQKLHYETRTMTHDVTVNGQSLELTISFSSDGSVRLARLDNININYQRALSMNDGVLTFHSPSRSLSLSGITSETRVWDVTDPSAHRVVDFERSGSNALWSVSAPAGERNYVAWNPDAAMPSPAYVGIVGNHDLHGAPVPEMVIITASQWKEQADKLADLHRNDPLRPLDVMVVDQDEVFDEFASGVAHIGAFRRMLKMMWDRGGGSASSESRLKYVLLMGRAIYDHRRITQEVKSLTMPLMPQWQTEDGGFDNTSYTTEDYLTFLRDGSGAMDGTDYHCISVGRIPVTDKKEAEGVVAKIEAYMNDRTDGQWKNRVLLVADDGKKDEDNVHMRQMEKVAGVLSSTSGGSNRLYDKAYVDAFPVVNNVADGARDRMYGKLKQGVAWWWFIGHANEFSWTGEGLLTLNDLKNVNFTHQPMLYAATCDFLRWDVTTISGAEMLFMARNGIIGAIAATRPVLISLNERISLAMAAQTFATDENGLALTTGEIMRRAKNTLLTRDTNKMRYVLLGDPALAVAEPQYNMVIDRINGETVTSDAQVTLKARQLVNVEGHVVDKAGALAAGFAGVLTSTLYDADYSTTSLGHNDNDRMTFEERGERIHVGTGRVADGKFSFVIDMPSEIASNFRPATLSVYASSETGTDAAGITRDLYVYGYDDSRDSDVTPPVIETFYLNSEMFRDGMTVSQAPIVIARVSDDCGVNLSSSGVGHQLSLLLDGNEACQDVVSYYVPGDDGPLWGTLRYQLSGLSEGAHTLRLRVWDTSNNMAESTIAFNVNAGARAEIINLYTDASPATDHADFYVEHNRPGKASAVTVTVYDLMGRIVWSGGHSAADGDEMGVPVTWNLTDMGGRRVPRGIYVYRAVVTVDGEQHASASRKLAVTAR